MQHSNLFIHTVYMNMGYHEENLMVAWFNWDDLTGLSKVDMPIVSYFSWLMWVKQCHKPSPSHHHFIGGRNLPVPVMGGLWHCFTHINPALVMAALCFLFWDGSNNLISYVYHVFIPFRRVHDGLLKIHAEPWLFLAEKTAQNCPQGFGTLVDHIGPKVLHLSTVDQSNSRHIGDPFSLAG